MLVSLHLNVLNSEHRQISQVNEKAAVIFFQN